jgi:transglutaminase-like putative cysteine protease
MRLCECTSRLVAILGVAVLLGATTCLGQGPAVGAGGAGPVTAEVVAVSKAARPDWVEAHTWVLPDTKATPGVPAEVLLSDQQDLLEETSSSYYYRNVVLLRNAEGVRRHAEWTVDYSPEYESITWHALAVHRSGEAAHRLETATFRRLQREQRLESRVFDGRITIAAVLEDIRVGDVIEIEYTLTSGNPALRGHLGTRHYLGAAYPVAAQHVIVRAPLDRTLQPSFFLPDGTQNLPPELFRLAGLRLGLETEERGAQRIFRWSGVNLPAIPFDDNIAPRASPYYPMLRLSSFTTWADVASWGRGLFSGVGELPREAKEWVRTCRAEHATEEARLAAAVGWVQQDLRYFAMAMGAQNLRPRKLAEICTSRYGDCKDKSALLVAVLRELGIEAWPALVSTVHRERVREYGPGPYAFDHAITVYRLGGQDHWIDPTLEHQRGSPRLWSVHPYRFGLILRKDETGLAEVPPAPGAQEPDSVTEDTVTVHASGEARLLTTTQLRGLQADQYRHFLASTDASEIGLRWVNYLGRFYRTIEEVEPLRIEDNPETNRITLLGSYRMPDFVGNEGAQTVVTTHAYAIRALLDPPQSRRRRWPYALPGERFVRHRIAVDLPFELPRDQQPQVVVTDDLVYRTEKGLNGRRFVSEHSLRILRDYVPADGMAVHASSVEDILGALSTSLRTPVEIKAPGLPPAP